MITLLQQAFHTTGKTRKYTIVTMSSEMHELFLSVAVKITNRARIQKSDQRVLEADAVNVICYQSMNLTALRY